jgi:general secretion pathway protein G
MTQRNSRRRRGGFTLMEVLLVLVILVVLGSIAVGVFRATRKKALVDAAKTQIGAFESPLGTYELHLNAFPESLEDLTTAPGHLQDPSQWAGPYLQNKSMLDPWGNEYQYTVPGEHNPDSYDVWSLGPDKADGTDDDIGNW